MTSTDLIDRLAAANGDAVADGIAELRRPIARQEAQRSYETLFSPLDDSAFPLAERWLVAAFATRLTADDATAAYYAGAAREAIPDLAEAALSLAAEAAVPGPYGFYPEPGLAAENVGGLHLAADASVFGERLAVALEHAHLLVKHPRDARGVHHERLLAAGWEIDGIVTLSQLIAFLAFQQRVVHGLRVLVTGQPGEAVREGQGSGAVASHGADSSGSASAQGSDPRVRSYDLPHPEVFVRDYLGWVPWIEPLPREEFTERHLDGLVEEQRIDFPYFRLLARDPEVLRARTLTDTDIFFNDADGLPRAERELSAAAASRVNGCVFCASVHARAAGRLSERPDDVDRLLAEGVGVDIDERWNAIISAAAALTRTPLGFGAEQVRALEDAGLSRKEIVDVIQSAAFFNWANRLMLSLGRAVATGVELPA